MAGAPWAVAVADTVDASLENALGCYPVHPGDAWNPDWDTEDVLDLAEDVPASSNIWTDGSRDEDLDSMVGVAGAGAFVQAVPWVFDGRAWWHAQDLDLGDDPSRIFSMVHGLLQTVQRAEHWGVILALQALMPPHLGVDNLNVCNNVAGVLWGWTGFSFLLCSDGDLLACIARMVRYRGSASVKVSKVKGHAADVVVVGGRVRAEDKEGNDAADIAADFGRLRQPEGVVDARRNLLRAKKEWYPRILSLHRFMVAIARESLKHSSGAGDALHPLVWDSGSLPKTRRLDHDVIGEFAQMPRPEGFLDSWWCMVDSGPISGEDIASWPYSVSVLVKFTSFLSTLHWPEGLNEMGKHGISLLEVLILFERWVGHRFLPDFGGFLRQQSPKVDSVAANAGWCSFPMRLAS